VERFGAKRIALSFRPLVFFSSSAAAKIQAREWDEAFQDQETNTLGDRPKRSDEKRKQRKREGEQRAWAKERRMWGEAQKPCKHSSSLRWTHWETNDDEAKRAMRTKQKKKRKRKKKKESIDEKQKREKKRKNRKKREEFPKARRWSAFGGLQHEFERGYRLWDKESKLAERKKEKKRKKKKKREPQVDDCHVFVSWCPQRWVECWRRSRSEGPETQTNSDRVDEKKREKKKTRKKKKKNHWSDSSRPREE